jgi:cytochrome c peroxidase
VVAILILAAVFAGSGLAQGTLSPIEALGEKLYFDANLSDPDGQSCASCHDPTVGFDDPDSGLPVSEGIYAGRFGNRNSPMSAYAMYAPAFHWDEAEELYIGGQFWDGRATGQSGGVRDPLADQAIGPPLNPVEMANPDKATYVAELTGSSEYIALFETVWGTGALDDVDLAYDRAGQAVAAFERTALFGQFSSKYDYYLSMCLAAGGARDDCAIGAGRVAAKVGKKIFTSQEWDGFQLFMNPVNNNDGVLDKGEGAMCVLCHVADWTQTADYDLNVVEPGWAPAGWVPPVFTDFSYDNLGLPKNWDNPFLYQPPAFNPDGVAFIDYGLGAIVGEAAEDGKFKVMTLRNIAMTNPYGHNGLFGQLKDITHFYNTRDALPGCDLVNNPKPGHNCWDVPEVPATVNFGELGNLGLSDKDEDRLVEFMKTLSDGWWTP